MAKNFYVIIPAYNEAKNIGRVIKNVRRYSKNVIVVDDGSTDRTYQIARKNKAVAIKHIVNLGKGAALRTGCEYAIKNKAEDVIVIDADGQHNPKEIPIFLMDLRKNDIVFSYRKRYGKIPFVLRVGNYFINLTIRILYGIKLRDTQCGFRAFKTEVYRKLRWSSWGYSVESEMIANAGKHKLKYSEIPIETIYSDKYKGTGVLEGIQIVIRLFWWKIAYILRWIGELIKK